MKAIMISIVLMVLTIDYSYANIASLFGSGIWPASQGCPYDQSVSDQEQASGLQTAQAKLDAAERKVRNLNTEIDIVESDIRELTKNDTSDFIIDYYKDPTRYSRSQKNGAEVCKDCYDHIDRRKGSVQSICDNQKLLSVNNQPRGRNTNEVCKTRIGDYEYLRKELKKLLAEIEELTETARNEEFNIKFPDRMNKSDETEGTHCLTGNCDKGSEYVNNFIMPTLGMFAGIAGTKHVLETNKDLGISTPVSSSLMGGLFMMQGLYGYGRSGVGQGAYGCGDMFSGGPMNNAILSVASLAGTVHGSSNQQNTYSPQLSTNIFNNPFASQNTASNGSVQLGQNQLGTPYGGAYSQNYQMQLQNQMLQQEDSRARQLYELELQIDNLNWEYAQLQSGDSQYGMSPPSQYNTNSSTTTQSVPGTNPGITEGSRDE